jgi:hypothetical protein
MVPAGAAESKKQIVALESNHSRHAEDRGHGWVDITTAPLSRLKLHVAELDELLREYEAERSVAADTQAYKENRSL